MNNLISIIIPVFNRQTIIKQTIDSILSQTYSNWECVLVDDGSTDKSIHTINQYVKTDGRIMLFERPENMQKGANACRNYGFKKSNGIYINWFDSDDIMEPEFLEKKLLAFTNNTEASLHRNKYSNYTLTRFRDSKFKYSSKENLFYHYAMDEIEIQTCGFMWKKEYLLDKPLFNEKIQRFQDNEFHIRMLALNPNIEIINDVLATIRGGDGDSIQISSRRNISKKKLHDIFYYRYQTLKLNLSNIVDGHKEINEVVSKKTLWTFYDALKFEKNIFKRIKDLKHNYNKLKLVYSIKEISLFKIIKSHIYIFHILIFGNMFQGKK